MAFKKLGEVEVVAEPTESANVLIEEDGVIKRVSKDEVGGNSVSSWNDLTDKPELFSGSWNDLTDKPFYEHTADVIFSEQTVNDGSVITLNSQLVSGDNYTVTVDGSQYPSECVMSSAGKFSLEIFTPTRPIEITQTSGLQYKVTTMSAFTLSIKHGKDELVQIDKKYLPKATAVADAAGDTPTAEEFNALLTALRNAGYLAT